MRSSEIEKVSIAFVATLAKQLDDAKAGSVGIRFMPRTDGSGLYCIAGAENDGGKIGDLCRDYKPAPALSAKTRRRIANACSDKNAGARP